MVTVSKRNNLGTYGTCCPRPCGNSDQECHHHDSPLRLTYAVGDEDQENEGWDNGEQVGKEQNQVVHKTSKVTCKKSEEQSDHGCNDSRNQTNFQG